MYHPSAWITDLVFQVKPFIDYLPLQNIEHGTNTIYRTFITPSSDFKGRSKRGCVVQTFHHNPVVDVYC